MFVFALVMATYMPCLGVMAALIKEFDIRSTLLITISSVALAIVLGTIANYTFQLIALL
jgi:Fe2+ transport system protein B